MVKAPVSARLNRHLAADLTERVMAQAVVRTMTPERSVVRRLALLEISTIHARATVPVPVSVLRWTETVASTIAIHRAAMCFVVIRAAMILIVTQQPVHGAIQQPISVLRARNLGRLVRRMGSAVRVYAMTVSAVRPRVMGPVIAAMGAIPVLQAVCVLRLVVDVHGVIALTKGH